MSKVNEKYPVKFEIEYPGQVNRVTSFFRILWAIPALLFLCILTSGHSGVASGIFIATIIMIAGRQKYPRWWFDFALEMNRFSFRTGAYLLLLTDQYPSTTETQAVQLDIEYPDVQKELNRWLPLVKWFLAIPHYILLAFLALAVVVSTVIAWFAILFTGQYPRSLFDFVVGVGRWSTRVNAYAFLLTTDKYPPFSLG